MSRIRFLAEEAAALGGLLAFSAAVVVLCGAMQQPLPAASHPPAQPTAHAEVYAARSGHSPFGRTGVFGRPMRQPLAERRDRMGLFIQAALPGGAQ